MLYEGSSDIVEKVEAVTIRGEYAEALTLFNAYTLAIDQKSIALYKRSQDIYDELGNGLIDMSDIPVAQRFDPNATPWVTEYKAGYVGFNNNAALIILPNSMRLFRNKSDALRNEMIVCELNFT